MSIERPIELTCPICEHDQVVVVWESLNADVSPTAREQLFEGRINVFDCEGCGKSFPISTPLLYHDMTRRFLVQFYPFENIEDDEFLARFDRDGHPTVFAEAFRMTPKADAFQYMTAPHVVFSMDELVRHVLFRERCFDARPETFRFHIAGFTYHEGPRIRARLEAGGQLSLLREPDNPHDHLAVAVYQQDDRIGYVPRARNQEIADRLDRGLSYQCRIVDVDPEEVSAKAVEVEVAFLR